MHLEYQMCQGDRTKIYQLALSRVVLETHSRLSPILIAKHRVQIVWNELPMDVTGL